MTISQPVKPMFLVVGAEKSGTSTFCHQLSQHPQIFVSTPKEPHFFSFDERFEELGMDWYYNLFEAGRHALAVGEGSVSYSYEYRQDRVISRLLKHLPDVQLVYLMRHPVQRIESIWTQIQSLGQVDPNTSFADYINQHRKHLFDNSCYWDRVNTFREHFPDDRILLLFLDELTSNPVAEYRKTFSFLGVDPDFCLPEAHTVRNRSSMHRDRRVVDSLKTNPVLKSLSHLIPSPVRHRFLKRLRVPIQPVNWNTVDVREEMKQLKDQAALILEHCQMPQTMWDIPVEPDAIHH